MRHKVSRNEECIWYVGICSHFQNHRAGRKKQIKMQKIEFGAGDSIERAMQDYLKTNIKPNLLTA
jgi:hypothetical protein